MKFASQVSTATKDNLLLQGVMGMNGEAGEAIDIVKKYLSEKRTHIILWYTVFI